MKVAYTFCTLVTDCQLYERFINSAKLAGFGSDCEYITVDNTGATQTDAYRGLNSMIGRSQGEVLVLCHQDILFDFDNRQVLEDRLIELEQQDPSWAVCGVAGRLQNGKSQVTRITDKFGKNQISGEFPSQVMCLDECIIITKRSAGVRLSYDVSGFHLYGTDICLIAEIMGYNAYVINFHLRHLGSGRMGSSYEYSLNSFKRKWFWALRDRHIRTTASSVFLTGRRELSFVRNLRSWVGRKRQKLFQR